jgi:hypothetical protein
MRQVREKNGKFHGDGEAAHEGHRALLKYKANAIIAEPNAMLRLPVLERSQDNTLLLPQPAMVCGQAALDRFSKEGGCRCRTYSAGKLFYLTVPGAVRMALHPRLSYCGLSALTIGEKKRSGPVNGF